MKLSPQTSSFIFIAIFALFSTGTIVHLDGRVQERFREQFHFPEFGSHKTEAASLTNNTPELQLVDASNWATFTDSQTGLHFTYPPLWSITEASTGNTRSWKLTPLGYTNHMTISTSAGRFIGISDQELKQISVNGIQGVNLNNKIFGLKHNDTYYTFDIGNNTTFANEFYSLVHSVTFSE
jgi:hypothetical protein